MCVRVDCSRCGRPTHAGCGAHVEQVLRDVPRDRRCRCREERAAERDRASPADGEKRSWLKRFFPL